jgi:hypothetical protein
MLSEGIMRVMFLGGAAAKKHNPRHIPDKSCVHTCNLLNFTASNNWCIIRQTGIVAH